MKITRLRAENVHGYLPIDIDFYEDLTFLTGLNGSGKTTVLRLLMALLTPTIDELGTINFSRAAVTVKDADNELTVTAVKASDGITLSVSGIDGALAITTADLELLMDPRRREEVRSPVAEKYQQSVIFQRIQSISTPMFLGLDRRISAPHGLGSDDLSEVRRRELISRRLWAEDPILRGSPLAALSEVNYLLITRLQEVRVQQEQLDEALRAEFFTKAFEYNPADLGQTPVHLPSRADIDKYRAQLETIARRAVGVRIPVPEIQSALSTFFERMTQIVDSMQESVQHLPKKKGKRTPRKSEPNVAYVEWIINKPQADRILEHLGMLETYLDKRTALHDPINRFLTLLNGFYKQTQKTIQIAPSGQLAVLIHGKPDQTSIGALSSGERQLLVMLAHLSLNPYLSGSGIFIVDEPELSLHIDWQERFVDAIREANPKVQIILATHSPAIILDRVDACRSLSWSAHA